MEEITEQNFKFISYENFLEKCKDPKQKKGIIKFLNTCDSFYCGLKIYAETILKVEDPEIKKMLILRLPKHEFIELGRYLIAKDTEKLIKENSKNNETNTSTDFTFLDLLSYFLNEKFNSFNSPEEIYYFVIIYNYLLNWCRKVVLKNLKDNFKETFDKEIDNYFFWKIQKIQNYLLLEEGNVNIKRPKKIFFDLCVKKKLGAWIAYAFARLPYFEQTRKNFSKVPEEFRVSVIALSDYRSWRLIDCLPTQQKQKLVDNKIITEEFWLNKKNRTNGIIAIAICSAIALGVLIALCIFAPAFGAIWTYVMIALNALSTALGIGSIISGGYDLYKINKFNKEVGISRNETTTQSNDTDNPTVEVEVKNENAQKNDSPNQTDEQPLTDNSNHIKNQNPNNDERNDL